MRPRLPRRHFLGAGLLLLLHASALRAQPGAATACPATTTLPRQWWAFENRGIVEPLAAEPRGSVMKVLLGSIGEYQFAERPGARLGMDLSVGKELPLFGVGAADVVGGMTLQPGHWMIGLWAPISFHMLWDLRDESLPIVNTDYRFGGMLKLARGVCWGRIADVVAVRFTPWLHESSHVGDEYTLAGRDQHPDTFERINVSFEQLEVLLVLDRSVDGELLRSFRIGSMVNIAGGEFYGSRPVETRRGRVVPLSSSRFEPVVQLERKFAREWLRKRYQPFVGVDMRYSVVYDYEKASGDAPDDRTVSTNLVLGLRPAHKSPNERGFTDLFVRVYHGVNPHGQFRNDPSFTMAGIGLNLVP